MSKNRKEENIDIEDGKVTTFSNGDEEPVEEDQEGAVVDSEDGSDIDEDGSAGDGVTDEDSPEGEVEFEPSTPEEAGCRAHGDTILKYPHLPNPEFEDFRAESILHCKREQPDVMELQEEEKLEA